MRKDGADIFKNWNLDIETKPVSMPVKIMDPGNLIMDEGKRYIDILKANLDRDT